METGFLTYENSRVHFLRFGQGEKLLIALHGFADQASMFLALQESLENEYTVYCLDLPFHGATEWAKNEYNRKDISTLFEMILKREDKKYFDLMGFSLGGRIVQKMLFEWNAQVDKVYLIAPYGLDNNVGFVPQGLISFLHWTLQKPAWFIKLIKVLRDLKLLNRFRHKFVYYHICTEEKRSRLFNTWKSLSYFNLRTRKVKKLFKKHPINVELYFGEKDKIIPVIKGEQLSKGLSNIKLNILKSNHRLINSELNTLLIKQLNDD